MSRPTVVLALILSAISSTPTFAQGFPGLSSGYVPWPARCYESRQQSCEHAARQLLEMWGFTYGLSTTPGYVTGVRGQYNMLVTCVRQSRITFVAVAGPDSTQTLNLVNQFIGTWGQGMSHCQ
jgi:hypothetical protein